MTVVDCDGHVLEYLEDKYFEEPARSWPGRPRIVKMPPGQGVKGEMRLFYEGRIWPWWPERPGNPLGALAVMDKTGGAGTNPHLRLKDMDAMGIDIAVLFPGVGQLCGFELSIYAADLCRAYNNWLADYCRVDSNRLKGLAMAPLHNVKEAVQEVRRAVEELGFVGVTVPYHVRGGSPDRRRTLDHPDFDPFWEECQSLDIAVSPHINTLDRWGLNADLTPNYFSWLMFVLPIGAMLATIYVVCGGVLRKFPKLRFSFVEAGIGWAPWWLERLDHFYEAPSIGGNKDYPLLDRKPSEYLRSEQCFFTCEADELTLPVAVKILGEDRIVWASDYPHHDSEKNGVGELKAREDLSESAKRKILGENGLKLYKIKY